MYHVINPPPAAPPFPGLYVAVGRVRRADAGAQGRRLARGDDGPARGLLDARRAARARASRSCSPSTTATPRSTPTRCRSSSGSAGSGDENIQLSGLPPSQGGLTDAQVRGLIAAGWELDTQGISHADLIALDAAQLHYQVATARQILRKRYGVPVNWFCYPSGHYDATVIAAVKAAGFVGSTTVIPGWADPSEDPYRLPRLRVLGGTSPAALLDQIAQAESERRAAGLLRRRGHGVSPAPRMLPAERPGTLRASRPTWSSGIAAAAARWRRPPRAIYPLKSARAGRVAERRLPARGAARLGLLGPVARARHLAAAAPPRSTSSTSRRSGASRSPTAATGWRSAAFTIVAAGGQHDRRAGPQPGRRGRAAAAPRPIWPPRWRASCSAGSETAGALAGAARRVAEALGLPLGLDRARARPRAIERRRALALSGARRRADRDAARAARAARRRRAAAAAHVGARRSGRSSRSRCAATRSRPRRSRPRRCGARTTSRPRCCAPSRTTCARR